MNNLVTDDEYFDFESYHMGTHILQRIYSQNAAAVATLAEQEIERLENLMSFFIDDSEVCRINNSAGIRAESISHDTLYVLNKSKQYSKLSSGRFDITAGKLADLWGVFTKHECVPSKETVVSALKLIDYEDIILNDRECTAKLLKHGQKIDLGAIAKGYAGDKMCEIYKQHGITSAFVNIGGNVMTVGSKPDGTPWCIGLQNPDGARGEYIGAISVYNKSVVTSGDYVRYFEMDNIRYHHILDPITGYPSESGLKSATVIAKSSLEADAVSTAIFVSGLEEGLRLVNGINGVDAVFITKDNGVYVTEGIKDNFALVEGNNKYRYI